MSSASSISAGNAAEGWQAFYADRMQRKNSTDDEALKAHFEAEIAQAKTTLQAMGISPDMETGNPPDDSPQIHQKSVSSDSQETPPDNTPVHDGESSEVGKGFPAALKPFADEIRSASEATGVPVDLLAAVIWDESRGVIDASSTNPGNGQTDMGLMQVNPTTFAALKQSYPELLSGSNLNDSATNIMAGALYLAEQKQDFGDWGSALRAYNSGPNNVNIEDLSDISQTGTGTANYVDKVMSYWQTIRDGGELPA